MAITSYSVWINLEYILTIRIAAEIALTTLFNFWSYGEYPNSSSD